MVGGEIKLVHPDHVDPKLRGLVCLGAAIGSDDFVAAKWREAKEKKTVDVLALSKLKRHEIIAVIDYCVSELFT